MRNNPRHRWPKAFEELEEGQWLAPFQRMETSPSSLGEAGFLLLGGLEEGNILNLLMKMFCFVLFHVAISS